MIQPLIDAAAAALREQLGAVLPEPERRVAVGPAPEPDAGGLPLLVLSPGRFEVRAPGREPGAGEPRPRPVAERLAWDPAVAAPLPLAHAPLEGSARGRLVLAEGTVAETSELLLEGHDFTVDPAAPSVAFLPPAKAKADAYAERLAVQVQARVGRAFSLDSPADLSAALFGDLKLPPQGEKTASGYWSTAAPVLDALAPLHPVVPLVQAYRALKRGAPLPVVLEYAFAGVFAVREFQQALLLDVYDADAGGVERWSSLAAGVLLAYQDDLLAAARRDYASRRSVSTAHHLTRLELAEGTPDAFEAGAHARLAFRVGGQLVLAREEPASLATIRHVRGPGTFSDAPVDVPAGLG
ncbi:MAG TPA: DNA polymerase [Longimicrobium sp.]|nr:DNA polymerase [Longimicrobium sp.]